MLSQTSVTTPSPEFIEASKDIARIWRYLAGCPVGVQVRLETLADGVRISPERLRRLISLLEPEGIELTSYPVCRRHDDGVYRLEEGEDGTLFCSDCDKPYPNKEKVKMEEHVTINKAMDPMKYGPAPAARSVPPPPLFRPGLEAWDRELVHGRIQLTFSEIHGLQAAEILQLIQSHGISWYRLLGMSPSKDLLTHVEEMFGTACEEQNDYKGKIKEATPRPDGPAGSAENSNDLDLHVDGTQTEETPVMLALQYVHQAEAGAGSTFIDVARALADLPEDMRIEHIYRLSVPDAATFSKKGMTYSGPLFEYKEDYNTVAFRGRLDDVMKFSSHCQESGEFLMKHLNKPQYKTTFHPAKGDFTFFDNWRLMHARTRVLGDNTRTHRRLWIKDLTATNRATYGVGLRFRDVAVLARIRDLNRG